MPTPSRRESIFISDRRPDSAGRAERRKDDLSRLLGERVFMEMSDIAPGTDFDAVLPAELASCGAVLALADPCGLPGFDAPREGLDWVQLQLAHSLASEGVQVVPVLMRR